MVSKGTFYSCYHVCEHTHTHTQISNILKQKQKQTNKKKPSAIWASARKPGSGADAEISSSDCGDSGIQYDSETPLDGMGGKTNYPGLAGFQ